jgi:FkbM family methyltransferase|tara:strand:- start:293 stop:898 length:606 start_codon:yes stop_codon:yes gene_type:complete
MKKQKKIWIPEKDTWSGWSENYESREYKKLQLNGNLCLDIGAHVGIWTKRLSRDFSQVICFEPLQKHIECHKKNCENLSNVTLYACALSDVETNSVMSTRDFNSGMSSLLNKKFKDKDEVIVKTKTLDSFNLPKVDFMKIDVEGYEAQVLSGAKETITKWKPKIYIEIWEKNVDIISKILDEMGYSITKMSGLNYLAVITR